MMKAITEQLSFKDPKDMDKYQPYYLHRQAVVHFIKLKDLLKKWLTDNVRSLYWGWREGGMGDHSVSRGT